MLSLNNNNNDYDDNYDDVDDDDDLIKIQYILEICFNFNLDRVIK